MYTYEPWMDVQVRQFGSEVHVSNEQNLFKCETPRGTQRCARTRDTQAHARTETPECEFESSLQYQHRSRPPVPKPSQRASGARCFFVFFVLGRRCHLGHLRCCWASDSTTNSLTACAQDSGLGTQSSQAFRSTMLHAMLSRLLSVYSGVDIVKLQTRRRELAIPPSHQVQTNQTLNVRVLGYSFFTNCWVFSYRGGTAKPTFVMKINRALLQWFGCRRPEGETV